MSKPDFGLTKPNESPDLSMVEITQQLFNNKFLSDVQFHFGSIIIYAHSWELMKRSVVFQHQLISTIGELKLIPVNDTTYDVFYQFIRFIYTDECHIVWHNQIELLKLARKFKIVKLETKIINAYPDGNLLKMLEYCILGNYDLAYRMKHEQLQTTVSIFNHHAMLSIHPEALKTILKFDCLRDYKEIEVFDVLIKWINKSCEDNKISRSDRRSRFDKLIRLIRFPTMSVVEFSDCLRDNKDLFTNEDIATIFKQISLGVYGNNGGWNATPRLMNAKFYTSVKTTTKLFKSTLSVASYINLCGLRFGGMEPPTNFSIQIEVEDPSSHLRNKLTFKYDQSPTNSALPQHVVNLGDTIKLKPNFKYTIEYKIISDLPVFHISTRLNTKDVVLSGPRHTIKNLVPAQNLFEIIYAFSN